MVCGGLWTVADTQYQKSLGVTDSQELFYKEMLEAGNYANHAPLVKNYVQHSPQCFEWVGRLGVRPISLMASGGMSVPRAHVIKPVILLSHVLNKCIKLGLKIQTRTKCTSLIENGREIIGVKTTFNGKTSSIYSRHGVLLTSGGFARNTAWLNRYVPGISSVETFSGNGNTGDCHQMALNLGAQIIDTEFIKPSYGFIRNASSISEFTMIFYAGAVMVNQEGRRFIDESISYKDLGLRALNETNGQTYLVFDENIRKSALQNRPEENHLWGDIKKLKEVNYVHMGFSIQEAAHKAGLNPRVVNSTIEHYNHAIKQGLADEAGRTTLSGHYGKPIPISKAPFFVMPCSSALMGTYCGIKTSENCAVLDSANRPINGLWAAGEIIGGVHGANYVAGTGLGKALVLGSLASLNAIKGLQ